MDNFLIRQTIGTNDEPPFMKNAEPPPLANRQDRPLPRNEHAADSHQRLRVNLHFCGKSERH
jgi:hypothetical protein